LANAPDVKLHYRKSTSKKFQTVVVSHWAFAESPRQHITTIK